MGRIIIFYVCFNLPHSNEAQAKTGCVVNKKDPKRPYSCASYSWSAYILAYVVGLAKEAHLQTNQTFSHQTPPSDREDEAIDV